MYFLPNNSPQCLLGGVCRVASFGALSTGKTEPKAPKVLGKEFPMVFTSLSPF